jgi:hypothetical protein
MLVPGFVRLFTHQTVAKQFDGVTPGRKGSNRFQRHSKTFRTSFFLNLNERSQLPVGQQLAAISSQRVATPNWRGPSTDVGDAGGHVA